MIVGCYTLHLYCNECNALGEFNSSFHGTLQDCLKEARNKGWRADVGLDKCYCPKHHDKKSRTPNAPRV